MTTHCFTSCLSFKGTQQVADTSDEEEGTAEGGEPPKKKRRVEFKLYSCPNDGCIHEFRHRSAMEQHLLIGKCDYIEEKQGLMDRAKSLYANKLTNQFPKSVTLESARTPATGNLEQGWALKKKKPKANFTMDQKAYLTEKLNIGKRAGRKADPFEVAEEMRISLRDGERRFNKADFLSGQQVASFFSRLAQRDKKCLTEEDYVAAAKEEQLTSLKQEIFSKL
ncbi:MAG: hypothetical protein AB2693_28160 [Candidatus Thiodiazotropha sp.]